MDSVKRALTAAEAAELLGVKPATLYAYVSRGLVQRERGPDGHSRFLVSDLEQLGRRSRAAGRAPAELPIESAITAVGGGSIFYRGEDALGLARDRSFEEVAGWLWVGAFAAREPWHPDPEGARMASAVQAVLPADSLPLDRLRVSAAALAAADPMRYNTREDAVVVTGRRLLSALAGSLPRRLRGRPPALRSPRAAPLAGSVAGLMWAGLGSR